MKSSERPIVHPTTSRSNTAEDEVIDLRLLKLGKDSLKATKNSHGISLRTLELLVTSKSLSSTTLNALVTEPSFTPSKHPRNSHMLMMQNGKLSQLLSNAETWKKNEHELIFSFKSTNTNSISFLTQVNHSFEESFKNCY